MGFESVKKHTKCLIDDKNSQMGFLQNFPEIEKRYKDEVISMKKAGNLNNVADFDYSVILSAWNEIFYKKMFELAKERSTLTMYYKGGNKNFDMLECLWWINEIFKEAIAEDYRGSKTPDIELIDSYDFDDLEDQQVIVDTINQIADWVNFLKKKV